MHIVQLEEDGGGLGGCMDNDAGGGGVRNGKGSFHPISQTMLIVPPDSPLMVGVKTLPAYYQRVLGGGDLLLLLANWNLQVVMNVERSALSKSLLKRCNVKTSLT